jgi:hypothetical protein
MKTKMSKFITPELINERLEAKGFGEKQTENNDAVRESVLKYYGYKLIDEWPNHDDAEFFIYPESTCDGYEVYVATANPNSVNICEDVHYYDSDLGDTLADAIRCGNGGDEDYREKIYVDDLDADYVHEAMQDLFEYLSVRFEEEVINELINEGYEREADITTEAIA